MKKSVFLVAVILFLFAGLQESASAQPPVNVLIIGPAHDVTINLRPWRVEISRGQQVTVNLNDTNRLVTNIELNNTNKTPSGCPSFDLVSASVPQPPGNATLSFTPTSTTNQWCKYNIVLTTNQLDPVTNQPITITIDPDFRIR